MSKQFARLYPKTKIFAFEPLPIFKIKLDQLNLYQVAIGSYTDITKFYVCKHKASSSLTLPDIKSKWLIKKSKILGYPPKNLYQEIKCPITTIDKVVSENSIKSIFLLKIDVEGSELDVIEGAQESLRWGVIQNIQFENHDNDLRKNHKLEIFNLLSSYNYVHKKSLKHFFGSFTEEIFSKTNIQS